MTFVTRSGSQLMLGSSQFRFAGCNCYWLGYQENPSQSYPTQAEIDDVLNTAAAMGLTVMRAHTLGISVGNSNSIWPTNGSTNTVAFATIDYAIYKAGLLGIKLLIPLTDNYHNYHGGKHTFTDWRSVAEANFYTDTNVIADFKAYITVILTRINQYTSVAYKDDPAILAWELGNELHSNYPGNTWTTTIASYIKSVDANHLVMDGTGWAGTFDASVLSNAYVDIYGDHYYPTLNTLLASDVATIAAAGKVFVAGEYDWTKLGQTGVGNGSLTLDTTVAAPSGGSNSAKITVLTATTDFYIQLTQPFLPIVNGHSYTLSFWIKSDTPSTQLKAVVQNGANPFNTYVSQTFFAIGTTWTQYTVHFTASVTNANAMIALNYGATAATTWTDLVSFSDDANGTNLVTNPSFETAIVSPWAFNLKNVAHDDLPAFLAAVEANANVSGVIFWNLMPHDGAGGWITHNDGYSLYYDGTSDDMKQRIQYITSHGLNMQRGIGVTNKAWMGIL